MRPDSLPALSVEAAFVQNQFREARNEDGKLALLDFEQEQKLIFSLPLEHV